jgi:hypothetical protein
MSAATAMRLGPMAGEAARRPIDPAVSAIAAELGRESGAAAVLFYGSNLRTGSLYGVLDFYVLLPGPLETGLWPRVSYREWERGGTTLRAKIATMQLATFARAAAGRTLDTTIWSRFVQPSALVWVRGPREADAVHDALDAAARTAAWLAVALGPQRGTEGDYWRALFRATYRAELRVEAAGREDSIVSANQAHFSGLLPRALAQEGIACERQGVILAPRLEARKRRRILRWWERRRQLGKPLNIVRLLRAAATFEGAARYAAWKVERHTGLAVELTPWRERHPVLAAPGILWRLSRARRAAARSSGQDPAR